MRALPSWRNVFTPDGVRLQLVDSWSHLRSMEFFALHFPHRLRHDPLAFFPGGADAPWPPLFDVVVGAAAWLTAGGAPTVSHIETVAALAPPLCGAGTVFVLYWVARRLFGSPTAQLAACLAAVLPGPFFVRSTLGFSDHHAFEVLLATILFAAVLGALDLGDLVSGKAGSAWKAGLALALYLAAWNGASLVVAILGGWAALQIAIGAKGPARRRIARVVLSIFGLAALAVLAFWSFLPQAKLALVSLFAGSVLVALALLLARAKTQRGGSVAILGGVLVLGAVTVTIVGTVAVARWAPWWWTESLGRLMPSGAELSVSEMRPLLLGFDGRFSLVPAWKMLGPMFFLFLVAWPGLAFRTYRQATAERTLLMVWSGALLGLTLLQFRFAASLGPFCALLVAWGAMRFLETLDSTSAAKKAMAWIVILLLAVYPSTLMALRQGSQDRGPSNAWWEALDWLREESPSLQQPAQYGVLAWWDYGSLITYRARRAPMANGSGLGIHTVAEILTEVDANKAEEKVIASGARYILIDEEMVLRMTASSSDSYSPRALEGKILGALQWADKPREEFVEIVDRVVEDGTTVATPLYFPKYFQTLASRLFIFGGAAVEPEIVWLVHLEAPRPGERRLLRQQVAFHRTEEAQSFLQARRDEGQAGWEIASFDPIQTPTPLAAMKRLRPVYPLEASLEPSSPVRIFEVVLSD